MLLDAYIYGVYNYILLFIDFKYIIGIKPIMFMEF